VLLMLLLLLLLRPGSAAKPTPESRAQRAHTHLQEVLAL
jgi:hypothetical protein